MLKELTKKYIEAIGCKDLDKCAELFADDFTLEDPIIKRIEGKSEVLNFIKDMFDTNLILEFNAKSIYQDNQTTIIEFILKLDNTVITGTDIIDWENKKMKVLRAYFDIPKS